MKRILIAVPTNKYIEPETFKSIYDQEIPEGYSVDFQFFYGYQIDQIRNLIAHWAVSAYDYLFSVDSDIVLPKDALKKLLAADKDIISGLYIQRKPGEHILEIYKMTPSGGCTNITAEQLADLPGDVVNVAACGMGCCLIKSEVLSAIGYPQFVYKSALQHKHTVSEDVNMCRKAEQHGYFTWAEKTVICKHIGQTQFLVQMPERKPKPQQLTHLDKVAQADLLPQTHVDFLKSLSIKPRVIYDIGACVLHWTRHAQKIWPDASIFCFDASPAVRRFFHPHQGYIGPLSDQDGRTVMFYNDVDNPGGNSYYKETTGYYDNIKPTPMKTRTLDSVVKQAGWPLADLIKIDVQGAELDVLKGAENVLSNKPDLIVEAQFTNYNQGAPKFDDVDKFLTDLGYKCQHVINKNTYK